MPLPAAAVPLVISGVKALLKFRHRMDDILSMKEASADLPFLLPDTPINDRDAWQDVYLFFRDHDSVESILVQSNAGALLLKLKGQEVEDAYGRFAQAYDNGELQASPERYGQERKLLYTLYCEAKGVPTKTFGPRPQDSFVQQSGREGGYSEEFVLSYYILESDRLSRNPAWTRVMLATADTLLEVAGENAGLFVSNPKTRNMVSSLLHEFAVRRDWDDANGALIFKTMLGSSLIAMAENPPERMSGSQALQPLFKAIADARFDPTVGDDFVAMLISQEGFKDLVSRYITHIAEDTSFLTKSEFFGEVLSDTLRELGQRVDDVGQNPGSLLGVLEVALTSSAANVAGVLEKKVDGSPLMVAVLNSVAEAVKDRGNDRVLLAGIRDGSLVPAVFKTALTGVAENPQLITSLMDTKVYVGEILAGVADALAGFEEGARPTEGLLARTAVNSLEIISKRPELLAKDRPFLNKILAGVFASGAEAFRDGVGAEDFLDITDAAISSAVENRGLIQMGHDRYSSLLTSVGSVLARKKTRDLLGPGGLRSGFRAMLFAISSNPKVWGEKWTAQMAGKALSAFLEGAEDDPTRLLNGYRLIQAMQVGMTELARRGDILAENRIQTDEIKELVKLALEQAHDEIGRSIDGENIVSFLRRTMVSVLDTPVGNTMQERVKAAVAHASVIEGKMPEGVTVPLVLS
ncbi:MAG: hypothetical protein AAF984_05220 [Verrucomicrobiota bacterium]